MNIILLQEFKENFNNALELVENKQNLIKNEIQEIENFVNNNSRCTNEYDYLRNKFLESRSNKNIFKLLLPKGFKKHFLIAYKEFKINGYVKVFDDYQLEELNKMKELVYKQAEELAKYSDWLNDQLKTTSKTQQQKNTLTQKQKLLALYYMGLDFSKYDNKALSKILSQILGLGEENIRKTLSYLSAGKNEVRTEKNLNKVLQLFNKEGFEDITGTINKDLEKIK